MLNFYNSLSPTTKLVIQSFLSVLGSVLAGVATALYQSYTSAGRLDMQGLWNVSLVTFALLFGKTMHDWVPNHAQQLIQAYKDSEGQLRDALQRQQNISSTVLATQGKQVQSATTSSASAPAMPMIIQNSSPITPEHVQAISQQIAVNLANMATPQVQASQFQVMQQTPLAPAQIAQQTPNAITFSANAAPPTPPAQQNAYVDPMSNSAVLPVYSNNNVSNMPTQSVPTPQVSFSVPSRPAILP